MRRTAFVVGTLVVLVGASAAADTPRAAPVGAPTAASSPVSARPAPVDRTPDKVLLELDQLFGTAGPLPAAPDDVARVRAFVRDRLQQAALYDALATRFFRVLEDWRANLALSPTAYTLNKTAGPRPIYYLDRPCTSREAVAVHPWWDLPSTVLVCPSAYRPEVKADERLPQAMFCEAPVFLRPMTGPPTSCGCGANLVNCAQSREQAAALWQTNREEPIRTMQYIVAKGLPFSNMLTMGESVRSDLGDLFYARTKFFEGGPLEMPSNPRADNYKLRPRASVYAAGVLTTPYWLFYDRARRAVIANVWDDFLCSPFVASGVKTHELFTLDSASFRTGERMELTSKVGCQNCHARLENAVRAFRAFNGFFGTRFEPAKMSNEGSQFFVRSHTDQRASGPATPAWIGETMSKQPEFTRCMQSKAEEFVFRGFEVPQQAHDAIRAQFEKDENFGRMLEDLVVAYAFGSKALLQRAP